MSPLLTVEIHTIETPSLGDRSYLATDGEVAVVIDAQRDIDRILDVARRHGVRITHVLETHIHNDYVTGGHALAKAVGAEYVVASDDDVAFDRTPVRDGDVIATGGLRLRATHTPGHTFTHMSYVLYSGGEVMAVFSGGSLLFGSTGRPDLLGEQHADTLARLQHASAHRLAAELPPSTQLYPTHGFGSFCAASQSEATASTIGDEQKANEALTHDVDSFVRLTLGGLDSYPAYYAHMAPRNITGPEAADLAPVQEADADELRRRIDAGQWVVDLRTRTAFSRGHVPGTINIGRDGGFVTYLGWLIPWETPVTLLGETAEQVAEAQRDMARIGIDRPAASATGNLEAWLGGREPARFATASFRDLCGQLATPGSVTVLDVRLDNEWRDSHVFGALHIPLHELESRLADLPATSPVWVHCGSGYRAAIAGSLLERAGYQVVVVDEDYSRAADSGLPLTSGRDPAAQSSAGS